MNTDTLGASTPPSTAGLQRFEELAALDRHLAVSVTANADGSSQVAVVNVGVVEDPIDHGTCVAFVTRRGAKLANLRRRPSITLVVRAGWEWIAVTGRVSLIGPDDPHPHIDDDGRRALMRGIYAAAGGQHPDLAEYDRVMAVERRCAVLVRPDRFVTNPAGSEHQEAGS